MLSTTLSCLLFVVVITADDHIAFSKPIIETQYDIVRVEEILSNQRSKRSTNGDLPKTMFFHIRSEKTDAKLKLRRAPKIEIPTFVCHNGTIHSVEIEDFKKHGIYLDDDTGRPIMVSDRSGYYDLLGSVKINDTHLNLQPIEGGQHNLTIIEAVSYGADMLVGEGVNLERIKDVAKIMKRKKRRVRNKRQATVYTVEVLVVTDHSVKEKFMERNNNYESMADSELKTYYGFTLLGMAVRYESITRFEPETVIKIEGSGIIISNTEDDSPYNRDNSDKGVVQYFSGLVHFTDWVDANTNNGYLPAHDHAMWFTDHSLAEKKSTSVIGIAWLASMCTRNSTSIIEDYFSGRTEHIAAHELGHSLQALHDGQVKGCSDNNFFIMAAASYFPDDDKRSNPWLFSDCSASTIANFASKSKCLRSGGGMSLSTSNLAGQHLDADEQCRIHMGDPSSYFCRKAQFTEMGFELMCQRMFCYDPSSHSCTSIIAKDYTSCGNGRWCERGTCVGSSYAPFTQANCPQGDGRTFTCDYSECERYSEAQKAECCFTCPHEEPARAPLQDLALCPLDDKLCEKCRSNDRYRFRENCAQYRL